jgi:hypothetical protein
MVFFIFLFFFLFFFLTTFQAAKTKLEDFAIVEPLASPGQERTAWLHESSYAASLPKEYFQQYNVLVCRPAMWPCWIPSQ